MKRFNSHCAPRSIFYANADAGAGAAADADANANAAANANASANAKADATANSGADAGAGADGELDAAVLGPPMLMVIDAAPEKWTAFRARCASSMRMQNSEGLPVFLASGRSFGKKLYRHHSQDTGRRACCRNEQLAEFNWAA